MYFLVIVRTLELRKVKTLGPQKNFELVRPGQFRNTLIFQPVNNDPQEDDNPDEQLPTPSLPPFEPLVLWTGEDANDSSLMHKIEV